MTAPGCQALALVERLDSLKGEELRGLARSHTSPVCLMPWSSSEKGISRDVASIKQISLSSAVLGNLAFLDKATYTQEWQESDRTIRHPNLGCVFPSPQSGAERAGLIYGNKHPCARPGPSPSHLKQSFRHQQAALPWRERGGAGWSLVCARWWTQLAYAPIESVSSLMLGDMDSHLLLFSSLTTHRMGGGSKRSFVFHGVATKHGGQF